MIERISDRLSIVDSTNDYDSMKLELADKHLLVLVLGMLDDVEMEQSWVKSIDPSILSSSEWATILVRNTSHGFISDFIESAVGKLLSIPYRIFSDSPIEYPARVLHGILQHRGSIDMQTTVICHSQGGIITCNAVSGLSTHETRNMSIYFLGSANWTIPSNIDSNSVYCISNLFDYVSMTMGRYFNPATIRIGNFKFHHASAYCDSVSAITKFLSGA